MSERWKRVKLDTLLRLDLDRVLVDPSRSYPMVGVLSYGRGLFEREPIINGQTSYRSFYRLKPDHIVLSQLFGWEGAIALSSGDFAGKYVSPQFPTFLCDPNKLNREFFGWFARRPALWEALASRASGMGDRRRTLTPEALLDCEIPLPPLREQEAVVTLVEKIAVQVNEACELRRQASQEAERLFFAGCETILMGSEREFRSRSLELLVDKERGISYGIVQTGQEIPDGIRTMRAGDLQWFKCRTERVKRVASQVERTYQRTRLRGGELLLRIRGGVGAVAVCPDEMIGGNVSREIAVIPLLDEVRAQFAMYLLAAPTSQTRMSRHVKGTSYVGLNIKDVRSLAIPVPPLPDQDRMIAELDALQRQVESLRELQADTRRELDSLLQSVLNRAFAGELTLADGADLVLDVQPAGDEIISRRGAVACYIVNRLHSSPTFGRTQLMKGLYFAEAYAGIDLCGEYERQAAGPFDKSVYKIEEIAERQGWFTTKQSRTSQGHMKVSYMPLPGIREKASQAVLLLGSAQSRFDKSLALFERRTTREVEILATLYAAWNDLILVGGAPNDAAIIGESRENWHTAKQNISVELWRRHLSWMHQNGFVPAGTGKRTLVGRPKP